jgi:hypothetical protein
MGRGSLSTIEIVALWTLAVLGTVNAVLLMLALSTDTLGNVPWNAAGWAVPWAVTGLYIRKWSR